MDAMCEIWYLVWDLKTKVTSAHNKAGETKAQELFVF